MVSLLPLLAFACSFILVHAQNHTALIESLSKIQGLTFVYGGNTYDGVRQAFNLRFNVYPAVIAFPSDTQQVSKVVKASADLKYPVVARSGGHSYIANGLGGTDGHVVVDLRNLTEITVDPYTFDTVIQTGNRLGSVALGLNDKGRAMPHGVCPYVGVGGHLGHGGFGHASRMWGLAVDQVISADVVLADGSIVTASETSNADLFWVIRGSSSSYGIVTSYTVKTYKEPPSAYVYNYTWHLSHQEASQILETWQTFVDEGLPNELGNYMEFRRGLVRENVTLSMWGVWYSTKEKLISSLQPFFNSLKITAKPVLIIQGNGTYIDTIRIIGLPYPLDNVHTAPDVNDTFYVKSLMIPESSPLPNSAWTAFTKYLAEEGYDISLDWFMQVELYGGSNSSINLPVDASFAYRDTKFNFQLYARKANGAPPFPQDGFTFVDDIANSITSHYTGDYGAYLNYIDGNLTNWQQLYYASHYARLQSIKTSADPSDVFRFPLSVEKLI